MTKRCSGEQTSTASPQPIGPLEYRVNTARLTLRSVRGSPAEVDLFERLYTCPETMAKSNDGSTTSQREALAKLSAGVESWSRGDPLNPIVVIRRADDAHIGVVNLRRRAEPGIAELGGMGRPDMWGQGYGREAVEAVLNHVPLTLAQSHLPSQQEPIHTLWAGTRADNPASLKILGHLGFREMSQATVFGARRINFSRPISAPLPANPVSVREVPALELTNVQCPNRQPAGNGRRLGSEPRS